MNLDSPMDMKSWETSPGDSEPIKDLRNFYSFCAKPTGIKCRSVVQQMPYTMTQDVQTVCSLEQGFQCLDADQGGFQCEDYEVSVHCDCARKFIL